MINDYINKLKEEALRKQQQKIKDDKRYTYDNKIKNICYTDDWERQSESEIKYMIQEIIEIINNCNIDDININLDRYLSLVVDRYNYHLVQLFLELGANPNMVCFNREYGYPERYKFPETFVDRIEKEADILNQNVENTFRLILKYGGKHIKEAYSEKEIKEQCSLHRKND